MLDWLNQNSGAVQGISSALTALVTIVLILVTWRYVRLTERLSQTAQDQFNLGQRQYKLSQDIAMLPYLPNFPLQVDLKLDSPRVVQFTFSNLGNAALLVHYAEIQ